MYVLNNTWSIQGKCYVSHLYGRNFFFFNCEDYWEFKEKNARTAFILQFWASFYDAQVYPNSV